MPRYKYMRLKLEDISEDFIEEYNLRDKVTKDGYVYVEICKEINGLPQEGILAQELVEKRLNAKSYRRSKLTPGSGRTTGAQSCFLYAWMILEPNTLGQNMPSTSWRPSRKIAPSYTPGKESDISDSPLIGTMTKE